MKPKIFLFVIAIIIFSWIVRSNFIGMPLERDEGEYAYIAKVIDSGGVPYKDAFNQKPPAVFFTYLAIFKIFGETPENIHTALYFYTLISVFLLYLLTKQLYGENTAILASFIFSFITSERRLLAHAANTELFMLAPMIASWALAMPESRKNKYYRMFAAGFFASMAVLYKQVAFTGYIGILVFIIYLAVIKKLEIKDAAGRILVSAAGFAVPLAVTVCYFYKNHAFADFYYQVYSHNMEYSSIMKNLFTKQQILGHFTGTFKFIMQSQVFWWLLSIYMFFRILFYGEYRQKALIIFFLMSAAGVSAGFRFTLHYFLQIMPVMAILSAAGIVTIFRLTLKINNKPVRLCARAIVILLAAGIPVKANKGYYSLTPEELTAMIYSGNPFREAVQIAAYLKYNSSPEDKIFVLGSEPEIYFYSGRKSASKYIFSYPVTMPYSDVLKKQESIIEEIKSSKPLYILYSYYSLSFSMTKGTPSYLVDELNKIVSQEYTLDGLVIGGYMPKYYWGPKSFDHFGEAENAADRIYIYKRNMVNN